MSHWYERHPGTKKHARQRRTAPNARARRRARRKTSAKSRRRNRGK